ncbi:MAG: tetratricopeptide repeat protein [Verrucomicrobia bacterium]|nr:tetratricopeptide repeat protein [Verrucomicrobiota bacterium]
MKPRTKSLIRTAATACLGVAALACALPARAQVADSNNTARFQPSAVLVPSNLKPESTLQPESGKGLPQPKTLAPASERRSSTWERFGRQQPFVVVSDKTNVVIRSAQEDATAKAGVLGPDAVLVPSDLKPESALQPESGRGLPQPKTLAPASERRSSTWERFGRRQPSAVVPSPLGGRVDGRPRLSASNADQSRKPLADTVPGSESRLQPATPLNRLKPGLQTNPPTQIRGKGLSQSDRSGVVADTTTITRPSPPEVLPPLPQIVPSSAFGSNVASAWLPPPFVPAPVVFDTARLTAAVTNRVTLPSLPKALPLPSPSAPPAAPGSNTAPAWSSSTVAPAPVVSTTNRSEKTPPPQSTADPARSGREPSAKTLGARTAESAQPPVADKAVRAPVREKKPSQPDRSGPTVGTTNTTDRTSSPKPLPLPSPSASTSMLGLNATPIWLPPSLVPAPDAPETTRVATDATNTAIRLGPSQATTPPPPSAPASATPRISADLEPLMDQARELYSRQQFEEAAAKYREILKLNPENISCLSNLAVIRFQQGRLEDAEHLLNRALQIAPNDAYSHATVGIIYFKQDRFDDAVEELTRSLKLNSDNAEARNYLGLACWKKGRSSAAEQELRRAIEIRPDYADAHYNLAVIYATQKPPFLGLAKFHYRKTLEFGRASDPDLENTLAGGEPEK